MLTPLKAYNFHHRKKVQIHVYLCTNYLTGLIKRMVASLKRDGPCVPEVMVVQATPKTEKSNWDPNEILFYNMLIEDSTQYGEYNFSQFLETVQIEASKLLGGRKGN